MKIDKFWFKIEKNLLAKVQSFIASIGYDDGLVPNRQQAIVWTNGGLVCWCVSLGLSELTHWGQDEIDAILANKFKYIFLNENGRIPIWISLKFVVPRSSIDNKPALVQIMAWRRPGDKPLSEPMMIVLLTHMCVTRPQWVKSIIPVSVRSLESHSYFTGISAAGLWNQLSMGGII